MIYYFLSKQWNKLSGYTFLSMTAVIDGETISVKKSDFTTEKKLSKEINRLPSPVIRFLMRDYFALDESEEMLRMYCRRYDIPFPYIKDLMYRFHNDSSPKTKTIDNTLAKLMQDCHILYLPTYRRIEQDLSTVLSGQIEESDFQRINNKQHVNHENYTELAAFGMRDVQDSVDKMLCDLKGFYNESINSMTLSYLRDIVDAKYQKIDIRRIRNVNESTIDYIMSRVDDNILPSETKAHLRSTIDLVKSEGSIGDQAFIVCHYFLKLLEIHQELESKEEPIRRLAQVCNKYLVQKELKYDSYNFSLSVIVKDTQEIINLDQLSSGEKQIVSLFSYLTLSGNKNNLVLIDEPELSLSVTWQKMFLEDIFKSSYCSGIIAVTHSPFIFDNSLDDYARGLGEFEN